MVTVIIDEEVCAAKVDALSGIVETQFWDFVSRIVANPDDPALIQAERKGFRSCQFTSGWILDWEVTRRRRRSFMVDIFTTGIPEEVKLWDIRRVGP